MELLAVRAVEDGVVPVAIRVVLMLDSTVPLADAAAIAKVRACWAVERACGVRARDCKAERVVACEVRQMSGPVPGLVVVAGEGVLESVLEGLEVVVGFSAPESGLGGRRVGVGLACPVARGVGPQAS